MEKAVVIIPTYNEATVIAETVASVLSATNTSTRHEIHILVFDSNSTDNTAAIVQAICADNPRVHFASEPQKTGLGSAYLQAMRYALDQLEADVVIEFDADLSHQPKYILPMLEQLQHCDVVIGSRYVKGGAIPENWQFHRKLFSVLGNYVARFFLTRQYKDLTSGFRACRASTLNNVLPKQFMSNDYAYKLHLVWLLHQAGAKIEEYPIVFVDREQGYSKLPTNSITDSLRVVISLRLKKMRRYVMMCLVGLIGAIVQFAVYNLMRYHYSVFASSQIAVICAIASNFIFNNKFTFAAKQKTMNSNNISIRIMMFVLYSLIMVFLQSSWVHFATTHIGGNRAIENLYVATGMILGSIFNYLFYSRIIWAHRHTAHH